MSVFDADKAELMAGVLELLDVRANRTRVGWQPVRCPNTDAHKHGDKNPSGSVNLGLGYYTCHSCGLKGDGFDLMLEITGQKAQAVLDSIDGDVTTIDPAKDLDTWLV